MKKQLQKFFAKKNNNKGFTLIELIIVIAILAILVGIVGMASVRYVEKSRKAADEQTLDSVSTAVQAVIIDPENNITVADKGATITISKAGKITIPEKDLNGTDSAKFSKAVTDSLAKTPALKSQFYQHGADLNISNDVTTSGASIKVEGWTPRTADPTE